MIRSELVHTFPGIDVLTSSISTYRISGEYTHNYYFLSLKSCGYGHYSPKVLKYV